MSRLTIKQLERADSQVAFAITGAQAAELFPWFLEPPRLQRWWAEEARVEARVGGEYVMTWPSIDKQMTGVIAELDPPTRLVFSWAWADGSEGTAKRVSVEATTDGVVLAHGPYDDSAGDQQARKDHLDGWSYFLGLLDQEISGESSVR